MNNCQASKNIFRDFPQAYFGAEYWSQSKNDQQLPKIVSNSPNRLAPVLKTIFHQCVLSYTCSQSNSDGSESEPSELDWLQVYMTH